MTNEGKRRREEASPGCHSQIKRQSFPSYRDTPRIPPKVKLLCEIIDTTPSSSIEAALNDTGVQVAQPEIEQILKLSYSSPGSAVRFFRWAGINLGTKHSPYAWNLVVDLLGKNCLFDAMWDAIRSMKHEGLLSIATFASVFGSYVLARKLKEAIMTFEVMDQYGCARDVIALNSLLSAMCSEGMTIDALEFLHTSKNMIHPDADTYAIILEGLEKERNVVLAHKVFSEMVNEIGWDPNNVQAYDTFLSTLLEGDGGLKEAMTVLNSIKEKNCYPGMKFFQLALEECSLKHNDLRGATSVWQTMVECGYKPNTPLYNSMIALYCYNNNVDLAFQLFDAMIFNGAFPDSETYSVLFQFLVKYKRFKEASSLFTELVKNECFPSEAACKAGIKACLDSKMPYMAIKIWKIMLQRYDSDLEKVGNQLVMGLNDFDMLPEAVKYATDMIERGIKLLSSSLSKLKQSLIQKKKDYVFEGLLKKWKSH